MPIGTVSAVTNIATRIDVPLEAKIAFLRQPASYPEKTSHVEAVETHMSWVFLTERFAYKLKKPVLYDELDGRTPERRRFYCEEELRLNRRLAGDVYIEVVQLSVDLQRHLHFSSNGISIDWMVKMRRLPAERMLDYAIRTGAASADDIVRVAALIASFHRGCAPIWMPAQVFRQRLVDEITRNRDTLRSPLYQLPARQVEGLCNAHLRSLDHCARLIEERVRHGHIIEGHGDLRAEHVYLGNPVAVIDCIEFSSGLRTLDNADEIGFLALECERAGSGNLASALLRAYARHSGDPMPADLVHLYQSLRATMRARITLHHLDEAVFSYSPVWRRRAEAYLGVALAHAGQ